ncbi:MAG: hypothetical protein GY851_35440 [bacterium]|nr:hypothetical protein [bacterium]
MTMRKYRKGRQLTTLSDIATCEDHRLMIDWRGKTYHPAFIMHLQMRTVQKEQERGVIHTAVIRKEWLDKYGDEHVREIQARVREKTS